MNFIVDLFYCIFHDYWNIWKYIWMFIIIKEHSTYLYHLV